MKKAIIIVSVFALTASSCAQITSKQVETGSDAQDIQDTLIIKHENILNDSTWYSKSYSYYWLAGKDTLDFGLRITEWKNDHSLHLSIRHEDPILFINALENIDACFLLIKEDFDISKLASFHFRETVFYVDLAKKLSSEYEQEFGRKRISYIHFY